MSRETLEQRWVTTSPRRPRLPTHMDGYTPIRETPKSSKP
jgi:hypothetical protein